MMPTAIAGSSRTTQPKTQTSHAGDGLLILLLAVGASHFHVFRPWLHFCVAFGTHWIRYSCF